MKGYLRAERNDWMNDGLATFHLGIWRFIIRDRWILDRLAFNRKIKKQQAKAYCKYSLLSLYDRAFAPVNMVGKKNPLFRTSPTPHFLAILMRATHQKGVN